MTEVSTDDVLKFLESFKTRTELEKKFNLSNTESYNLITWLKNAKLIEERCLRVSGRLGRVWYYKRI